MSHNSNWRWFWRCVSPVYAMHLGMGAEAAAWDDSTILLSRLAESRCVPRRTPWQKAKAVGRPSAAAIRKGARQ